MIPWQQSHTRHRRFACYARLRIARNAYYNSAWIPLFVAPAGLHRRSEKIGFITISAPLDEMHSHLVTKPVTKTA